MNQVKRIVIIGPCGSGKSTLSRKLAAVTSLPLHHLDRLFWKPGWVESSREELIERLEPICASDRWIIDGNYNGTLLMRLKRADTVVFLNYPRSLYLRRVIKRMLIGRWTGRPDMAKGCREQISPTFIRYVWRFHKDTLPRTLKNLESLGPDQTLLEFTRPRQTQEWLESQPR